MGLLERMAEIRTESTGRAWNLGEHTSYSTATRAHNDGRFSPESYGDYLATSNDIYAVANLRARRMARLQPLFFDGYGTDRTAFTEGPVVDLLRKVNPFWTFQRLARMDELCMCIWGETYWVIEKDPRGNPVEIWWAKPSQMRPLVHPNNYVIGYEYTPATVGDPVRFGADEVIWFRYPNPIDEFSALSPLAAARLAADTSRDMAKSNQAMFAQGMQMAGTITPPSDGNKAVTFSSDQARELELDLANRFTGSRNAHRWAVLRFDAKFNPMGVTQKDADFIAGLNLSFRQVCRVYGINPALLGDNEHATLANVSEFELSLWVDSLQPDADFKGAEVTEQLLPMFRNGPSVMEWDYSKIPALQEAESAVWDREAQQLDRGVVVVNEVRAKRGLPPVPWGDLPWMPVNKAQVGDDEVNPSNVQQVAQPSVPEMDDEDAADISRLLSAFNGHGRRPQGVLT